MLTDLSIPLHLAVHLAGLMASGGLAVAAWLRRDVLGRTWLAIVLGAAAIAVTHLAGGLVLVEGVAWPVYLRAAGYVAIAAGAAGPRMPVVAPVGGAIAPFAMHVTAGITSLLAAGTVLVGAMSQVGARTSLLAAGIFGWGISDVLSKDIVSSGSDAGIATAWVSLVGSALVLGWLASLGRRTVRGAVVTTMAGLVLGLTILLAATTGAVLLEQLTDSQLDDLDAQAASLVTEVSDWPTALASATGPIAATPSLAADLEAHSTGEIAPRGLDDLAGRLAELAQADFVLLVDRRGRVAGSALGNTEMPAGWVSRLEGADAVTAALGGATSQRALVVLRSTGDLPAVGAIVATAVGTGEGVDRSPGVVVFGRTAGASWASRAGAGLVRQVALVIDGQVVGAVFGRGVQAPEPIVDALSVGQDEATVDGTTYFLGSSELQVSDTTVDVLVAVERDVLGATASSTARDVFLRGVLGLLAALTVGVLGAGALTRPVRRLTLASERVAGGDLTTPVAIDRDDELGRLAVAFNTMTDAVRRREEELSSALATQADLRNQIEAITTSMSDGLVAVDRRGRVTLVNPAAVTMLGGPPEAMVGEPVEEVLVGEDDHGRPLADELGSPTSSLEATRMGTLRFGQTPVAVGAAPLRDQEGIGPVDGRVYVLRDRTRELELEEMRANIVANISHELRTPMVPVLGYAKRLVTRPDIAPQIAGEMLLGAHRAMRRIEQLIDVSELEGRRMDIAGGSESVRDAVDAAVQTIRQAGESGWRDREVEVTIGRGAERVGVHRKALHRLVLELVDNAMKFCSEGDVVKVATKKVQNGIEVRVTDRGVGLPDPSAETLDEDFHQGDPSATRRHGGVGAGLAVVRRIADGLSTELQLAPRRGGGTVARIVLPPPTDD